MLSYFKSGKNYISIITVAILIALVQQGFSQSTAESIVIGQKVKIQSQILNEEREIWIYIPNGYDNSDAGYPVVYLLDGPAHFHHTTGIMNFLAGLNRMPQMLLVAVANTDRTRDLTPYTELDTSNAFPTHGGADNFLRFLNDELMPYVEQNYRTESFRLLIGHSFGGLFAVHALMSRPEIFDGYVAISPSLWWNNQEPVRNVDSFAKNNPDLKKFLYLTMGNEGGGMSTTFKAFAKNLKEKAPQGFEWSFKLMEEETHGSIPHRTTYQAFEKLFLGWQIPNLGELVDAGGIEAVDKHYDQLTERYGYKINTPETIINQLGYRYIGQKKYDSAIGMFTLNVKRYPKSANVYDSLGDGYDANGKPELALKNYRKAVALAAAISHRNLAIYRANMARLENQLGQKTGGN